MSLQTLEVINQIHKYLIVGAIFFAFFHFIYLFAKAYKKYAIAENDSDEERERVREEHLNNWNYYFKVIIHPFKVFFIYTLCISIYAILVIQLDLAW